MARALLENTRQSQVVSCQLSEAVSLTFLSPSSEPFFFTDDTHISTTHDISQTPQTTNTPSILRHSPTTDARGTRG